MKRSTITNKTTMSVIGVQQSILVGVRTSVGGQDSLQVVQECGDGDFGQQGQVPPVDRQAPRSSVVEVEMVPRVGPKMRPPDRVEALAFGAPTPPFHGSRDLLARAGGRLGVITAVGHGLASLGLPRSAARLGCAKMVERHRRSDKQKANILDGEQRTLEARDEDRGLLSRWLDKTERNAFSRRSSPMALAIFAIEVLASAGFVTLAIAPLPWFVNVLGGVLAGLAIDVIFTGGLDDATPISQCATLIFRQASAWTHYPDQTHGWDTANRGAHTPAVDSECDRAMNIYNRFPICRSDRTTADMRARIAAFITAPSASPAD